MSLPSRQTRRTPRLRIPPGAEMAGTVQVLSATDGEACSDVVSVQIEEVGLHGLRFVSAYPFAAAPGEKLQLTVDLLGQSVTLNAEVRWCAPMPASEQYRCGCEFADEPSREAWMNLFETFSQQAKYARKRLYERYNQT